VPRIVSGRSPTRAAATCSGTPDVRAIEMCVCLSVCRFAVSFGWFQGIEHRTVRLRYSRALSITWEARDRMNEDLKRTQPSDPQEALLLRAEQAVPTAALGVLETAEARYAAAVTVTTAPVTVTTTTTT
jgi:hypothetical protein